MILKARDAWWALAFPVYLVIGTARHEAAHVAAALALGGRVLEFSILPSGNRMGYVEITGADPEWLWVAAPYLCDVLTFAIGYVWLMRFPPARHWLFINVFAVMLLSPLINSAYNYRGVFGTNDVGYLAQQLGSPVVHAFFVASFALYIFGIVRVLIGTRRALGR